MFFAAAGIVQRGVTDFIKDAVAQRLKIETMLRKAAVSRTDRSASQNPVTSSLSGAVACFLNIEVFRQHRIDLRINAFDAPDDILDDFKRRDLFLSGQFTDA